MPVPGVADTCPEGWEQRPRYDIDYAQRSEFLLAMQCFDFMSRRRSWSMNGVPSAVSAQDFEAWCRRVKVGAEMEDHLWRIVDQVDAGWLEMARDKAGNTNTGSDPGKGETVYATEQGLNPPPNSFEGHE